MNHYRSCGFAALIYLFQGKTFRQIHVQLNGGELPLPPQNVFKNEIQFGAIEGRFTHAQLVLPAAGLDEFPKRRFGLLPNFRIPDIFIFIFRVMRRNAHPEIVKAEGFIDLRDHVQHQIYFALNLLGSGEHVAVVLRQRPHARETGKFAAFFVAIIGGGRSPADGEFAV